MGKWIFLAYIKIGDRGSQRGPRHLCVMVTNGEPYATWRWRQVITGHHQEMHVGIIPWINEGSTFTIWVATPFLLLGAFRFWEVSIFACGFGGVIVGSNLFLLTARKTLAFRRCHDGIFDQNRVVRMFWGRRHDEGEGNEKVFCANDGKGKN